MQSSRDIFLKFEIVDLTGNWVHLSQVQLYHAVSPLDLTEIWRKPNGHLLVQSQ